MHILLHKPFFSCYLVFQLKVYNKLIFYITYKCKLIATTLKLLVIMYLNKNISKMLSLVDSLDT